MKKEIVNLIKTVMNSDFVKKLRNGELDKILSIDMKAIIKRYNDGDVSVLDDEGLKAFLTSDYGAYEIIEDLTNMKRLLSYKSYILAEIRKQKDNMTYSPEGMFYTDNHYVMSTTTYGEVLEALGVAEGILSDQKTYQFLNFNLKYESLKKAIEERKKVLDCMSIPSDTREKFYDLLRTSDFEVGIVRVDDTENGVSIHAGTKKDMEVADLIGLPFPADMDREGYDYGPHGDYYMPPRKVEKTFHTEDLTNLHKRMVIQEKAKRLSQRLTATGEVGYIICGSEAIQVTLEALCKAGIDPKSIGWKPLRLEAKPERIISVTKGSIDYISTKEKLGLQAELLLKGRK